MDEEPFPLAHDEIPDVLQANVPPFEEEEREDTAHDYDMNLSNDGNEHDDERKEGEQAANVLVYRPQIDLDSIVNSFSSEALIIRLLFVADVCPPLRSEALKILIEHVKNNTQNVNAYTLIYHRIEGFKRRGGLLNPELIPPVDQHWLETTTAKAQSRLDLLNSEFRHQKDDGVKESIRRAMDDVFHHHLAMGNIHDALKLYSRGIREYCTAPNYLIQMLLNWINASVYGSQWGKLNVLIPQAERAVAEALEREGGSGQNRNVKSNNADGNRKFIQSSKAKLNAVSGLSAMKTGRFKDAADKFMQVDLDSLDYPELLSNHDIACYGTICSLATYDRKELKEKVLLSASFRKFLESEPKFVDLLQKFTSNQFGIALDILGEIKDGLLLNVYLAPILNDLYDLIRKRAIVQYFEPFLSADLNRMAQEFRTSVEDLEKELVGLIYSKLLAGRIDSFNKVLHLQIADKQKGVYEDILKANKDLEETIRSIVIRSALQQQGVFIGAEGHLNRKRRDIFEELEAQHMGHSSSTGHRVLATVQRFFNAASSRIHPQAPEAQQFMEEENDDPDENMEN
ncbi:unnamed protein product [Bursaphelenchus xylophilus]|uniref:(pine wood nematode) hypothetical protein n=1 Tax=Bursaphelenchus xylophilus TaxID=6326 RepID=A0A1I7RP30_BURXY|nr:unnamed protein product [Bursaphelenchus xylophilus]CAG9124493.1 unnamed protein product [Bursaphelenchus xylophilus]